MGEEYLKDLVIARLRTMPPDVSFSVGSYGDFTRDDLIREVQKNSGVGREFAKIELKLLLDTPKIMSRLHGKAASSH